MKKRKMKQILKLIAKLQSERDLYKGNAQMEANTLQLSYHENDNLRATVNRLEDQISHMQTWISNLTVNSPIKAYSEVSVYPEAGTIKKNSSGYIDIDRMSKAIGGYDPNAEV
jgi:conjugal transfer/entry exclusion protein